MSISVTELISHVNRNYPIQGFNYEVRIVGGGNGNTFRDSTQDINLNCSSITIPGINMGFNTHRRDGIGHARAYATSKSFSEINMTFYESEGEPEREYFSGWIDKIYNPDSKRFSFYNNYIKDIEIIQYDTRGDKIYSCIIRDAFPSNISPMDRSYASMNQVSQFNVNIQFHEIEETYYNKLSNAGDRSGNPLLNLVRQLRVA